MAEQDKLTLGKGMSLAKGDQLMIAELAPVPPPSYQYMQAKQGPALHINALMLVTTLHLLTLSLAVRLAHRRCPPPLASRPWRDSVYV